MWAVDIEFTDGDTVVGPEAVEFADVRDGGLSRRLTLVGSGEDRAYVVTTVDAQGELDLPDSIVVATIHSGTIVYLIPATNE